MRVKPLVLDFLAPISLAKIFSVFLRIESQGIAVAFSAGLVQFVGLFFGLGLHFPVPLGREGKPIS